MDMSYMHLAFDSVSFGGSSSTAGGGCSSSITTGGESLIPPRTLENKKNRDNFCSLPITEFKEAIHAF